MKLGKDASGAIRLATKRLDRAQVELSAAMAELPSFERADKQIVSRRLRLAFEEIVSAKDALTGLLAPEDAEPEPEGSGPEDAASDAASEPGANDRD